MEPDPKTITLIATIGSSPAVLTETLYELHHTGEWPVDEVVIITTEHGRKLLQEHLFAFDKSSKGGFYQLCEELKIAPNDIKIETGTKLRAVKGREGNPVYDIRNRKDDEAVAEAIQETVRKQCNRKYRRVFALLSGGRKTMSAHLMSAMQLFARPSDRLIHVLVSEPFEYIRDFYFPASKKKMMERKTVTGETEGFYDAAKAKIDLIDIPFIRLRKYVQDRIDFSLPYPELLANIDRELLAAGNYPVQSLVIDLPGTCIYVNGKEHPVKLEPRQISILALFAFLNLFNGEPRDVTWAEVIQNAGYLALLHRIYRTASIGLLNDADDAYRQMTFDDFERNDPWARIDHWRDPNGNYKTRDFPKQRSTLLKTLENGLKAYPSLDINTGYIFSFRKSRRSLEATNRISVPVNNVDILGLSPEEALEELEL